MKYSEFKRKVEELGFGVKPNEYGDSVVHDSDHYHVATIEEKDAFQLDTTFRLGGIPEVFENLDGKKLFDILVEYARTPIEDRKDEKKYSIHPIRTLNYKLLRYDAIFNCCGYEDEDSFDIAFAAPYEKGVSTTFSESEAKEICDFFGWDFDKVAVEVEDDE